MSTEINGIELYLNDFATKSFLRVGDQDYITARICYRNELMLQYYWSALQAIEKYFKAIMLYNREPSGKDENEKPYGHNLEKLYHQLTQIEGLGFSLTERQLKYLVRVHRLGENRYMTMPFEYREFEIVELDNLVWTVRGYCTAEVSNQFQTIERSEALASLKSKLALNDRITLPDGYLEKVLADKKSKQRSALLWNNLYFGRKRKFVRLFSSRETSFPTHVVYPEVIEKLFELVHFPKAEKNELRQYRDAVKKKQKSEKKRAC